MELTRNIDELTREVWNFTMIRETLFLDNYYFMKKESKRKRKYMIIKKYDRLMKRDSNIEESEVPFNNEIKQEALNKYFDSVKCLRWSER